MSLRVKLTWLVALASAIPLVLVGLALIDVNARAVETAVLRHQIALADDAARTLEDALDRGTEALTSVAAALGDADLPEEARLALVRSRVEASPSLDAVSIYDGNGALIDVFRKEVSVPVPDALNEAARRTAQELGYEGDVVATNGRPRLLSIVPIRAGDRVTGYVAGRISLAHVQERVEHLAQLEHRVFVVDGRARIVAHPDVELAETLSSASTHPLLRDGVATRAARSAEIEQRGEAIVATVVPLPRRPFAVVVEVPRDVAYASLQTMRTIVLATIAVTLLCAIAIGVALSRRVTAPLAKLVAFAGDLAARRFDRRVEVTGKDELAALGQAMSRAAADLEASDTTAKREAAIRADLGRYLPGELVDKIVRREQDMALGGVRHEITVLFADVVAFTPLSERFPPEEVVAILNELFTLLTGVVFRHGGTVDKFVGDCVMALFGAPTRREDHTHAALAAAEDMLRWLETANRGFEERYGTTVKLAIGVHTGEAVVGNIGSETRMEYTAIGDVVNVAARLETMARPQQILVTRAVKDAAGDGFSFASLGEHRLEGRAAPLELFEVQT